MKSFVKNRAILSTRILTLLLGLFLSSAAQAEMIYAVRVNSLNGGDIRNYYSNCQFSNGNSSSQWCSQTTSGSVPYTFQDDTHDYSPVMLCDLGVVHTINSIDISPYANANTVKALKVEFYDTPALSGTPVFTKEFSDISDTDTTTLSLGSAVQARYVKFTLTDSYGGDRVGVGDVKFNVDPLLIHPTSASMNSSEVATLSGYSVNYLFDMDASKTWCSKAADSTNGYFNGTNKNPVFTFNFNDPQTLSNIFVQTCPANGNSLRDFQLEFYDNAGNRIAISEADASKYNLRMIGQVQA